MTPRLFDPAEEEAAAQSLSAETLGCWLHPQRLQVVQIGDTWQALGEQIICLSASTRLSLLETRLDQQGAG